MNNLVEHAKSELRILGYTGEEPEDDPNRWMWDNIIDVVTKFSEGGHSGSSASYAIGLLHELLQFKNLSPLTTNPDEWVRVNPDDEEPGVWQNRRNSEAFSSDGGKTYRLLSERQPTHSAEPHGTIDRTIDPEEVSK